MQKSENIGMRTFDAALFELYQEGLIDEEEALRNADSQNNVRLKIKLAREGEEEAMSGNILPGLSLEDVDEGEFGPI